MILADTRHHLTRDDAQLAARILARESGDELLSLESKIADEGIDSILDDPRLPDALRRHPSGIRASFALFAYVMIRHAFRQAGEHDRGIADYVASIVIHFGFHDRSRRISPSDDETYDALVKLCESLDEPDARRRFLVQTHLGNYALWLSGVFPDFIERRHWRRGGPDMAYYEELGSRGFQLAADHRLAEQNGLAPLYHTAAERFGLLRTALNTVSDTLMFPSAHSPERLMRQVRDEARWKLS